MPVIKPNETKVGIKSNRRKRKTSKNISSIMPGDFANFYCNAECYMKQKCLHKISASYSEIRFFYYRDAERAANVVETFNLFSSLFGDIESEAFSKVITEHK